MPRPDLYAAAVLDPIRANPGWILPAACSLGAAPLAVNAIDEEGAS